MDTSIKTNVSQNPIPSYVFTTLDINLKIDSLSDYLIDYSRLYLLSITLSSNCENGLDYSSYN